MERNPDKDTASGDDSADASDRGSDRGRAGRGRGGRGRAGRGRDEADGERSASASPIVSALHDVSQSLSRERDELARRPGGRPERERRLRSFDAAAASISDAIVQVTDALAANAALPSDGRYEAANDVLFLHLRVDVEGSNMVSGDIFAVGEVTREHLASFRSYPGVPVSGNRSEIDIVAQDNRGQRGTGRLSVETQAAGEVSVGLTFFDQLLHLPLNEPIHLSGRFKGLEMRELGLEVEREKDVAADVEWEFQGRKVTIESAFADAGLQVLATGRTDQIPAPPSGVWHDSQLHGLMLQYAQEPLDRREWNLHLLLLKKSRSANLFGVMFDSGDRDINNLPRQGAAVFLDTIKKFRPDDWQRKFIQTTVHELGHALNLAHRFERAVGRADSNSFMNYDWKYLGGENKTQFWRDFAFTFDADELAFLRHGPWHDIVPGGADFHTIPYWENTDGGYVPYRPEVTGHDLTLVLAPPQNDGIFDFAQPVYLTVTVKNLGARPVNLPSYILDPKSGFIEFVIKPRPTSAGPGGGEALTFRPMIHRCYDLEDTASDVLRKNDDMSSNVNLTFGAAGFTFASPGDYSVQAVLTISWSGGRRLTYWSNALPIRISYPKTREDERDGLDMFRWDVGMYLALGGSIVLSEAEQILTEIGNRRQGRAKKVTDPVVASILRCQALGEWRDKIVYDKGRHSSKRGDAAAARRKLQSIASIAPRVFDPETCRAMTAMIGAKGRSG